MHIVIALDSFKGCISSIDAGQTICQSILQQYPTDKVDVFPLADGGEGTIDALCNGLNGTIVNTKITGPLGTPVNSRYGYLPDSHTAIIEMSNVAGLPMVPKNQRNPLNTTTYGLGELILTAIHNGCRKFIIGIGGSATNDCGLGMLSALGIQFQKADGSFAGIKGRDLADITSFNLSNLDPLVKKCDFHIACDVNNPLCGANGCSAIFGPQKGATPEIVAAMDGYINHFATLSEKVLGCHAMNQPGAGAAGGLGFTFSTFLKGALTPGVDLILDTISIRNALNTADLLITGEGRMDYQTSMGKAPVGVAKLAKECQPRCRTIALCGCAKHDAVSVNQNGIDAYFPILHEPMSVDEAMDTEITKQNLKQTMQQILNLIHI